MWTHVVDIIKALGATGIVAAVSSLLTLRSSNRNAQELAAQAARAQCELSDGTLAQQREQLEATLAHERELEVLRLNHEANERRFEVRRAAINEFTTLANSIMFNFVPEDERVVALRQLLGLHASLSLLVDEDANLAASHLVDALVHKLSHIPASPDAKPGNLAMCEWRDQARRVLSISPLTASEPQGR